MMTRTEDIELACDQLRRSLFDCAEEMRKQFIRKPKDFEDKLFSEIKEELLHNLVEKTKKGKRA